MNIQLTCRLMAAALLSLTAAGCQGDEAQSSAGDALATQEAEATQQCVEGFSGIKNCATGRAKVAKSSKGIAVSGLVDVKTDGFTSVFPRATIWELTPDIVGLGATGQGLELTARDGDQVVSSLRIGLTGNGDQVVLQPTFTGTPGGSAYRVNLYQNNRFLGFQHYEFDYGVNSTWYDIHIRFHPINIGFRNHSATSFFDSISTGACVWSFRGAPGDFSLDVDGKQLKGDYLEIVEEVKEGHYPYTGFSGIDVKASAKDFTILGESFVAGK
ncbi:hypothetical protein D7Y13_00405 [Corallococcus praedator]|uniref:Lipoprotein n=1 Tax=Corallococcus praedator TaxID=2316724 RepID=A0ABX9QRZ9_9BACT|nr:MULTISPECIES: hypothetical protein [Corallococcus]RKH36510.1 hypothetical protein D7X75_00335 [Corallococcus sp. CA031C]RKI17779.1 hypothetical protein D7Y13_00405 [Corallococcus praedator]